MADQYLFDNEWSEDERAVTEEEEVHALLKKYYDIFLTGSPRCRNCIKNRPLSHICLQEHEGLVRYSVSRLRPSHLVSMSNLILKETWKIYDHCSEVFVHQERKFALVSKIWYPIVCVSTRRLQISKSGTYKCILKHQGC